MERGDLAVTFPAPSDGATVRPMPVEPNGIDFQSRPVFNDVALDIDEGERALSHALAGRRPRSGIGLAPERI